MVDVPDYWPDDDAATPPSMTVPVFPLPGAFLFPGQVLPLQIVEPRYRQMIEDGLDGPGRIVIAAVDSADGTPELRPIAGLGEIARHERLEDGRFLIWLGGVARVRIREVPSDRPYRQVACEVSQEIAASRHAEDRLRAPLVEALSSRLEGEIELDGAVPLGLLSDLLTQCIPMPRDETASLFEEHDVERRAKRALDAHSVYPDKS